MDLTGIDPNTVVGGLMVTVASKDILNRLLGPTADYIGGEIKNLAEKCNINLGRIFNHAVKTIGSKINDPGAVSPRVLKQVWSEGAFIEDELAAEYIGGLLASARCPDGKDDRVLSLLSTVRDLSVYDLRLHHLIYSLVRAKCVGYGLSLEQARERELATACIPFTMCGTVMDIKGDGGAVQELAVQSLYTLDRYDLVGTYSEPYMPPIEIFPQKPPISHSRSELGMSVDASHFGARLFLWAYGHSDKRIDQIFDPNIDLPGSADVPLK